MIERTHAFVWHFNVVRTTQNKRIALNRIQSNVGVRCLGHRSIRLLPVLDQSSIDVQRAKTFCRPRARSALLWSLSLARLALLPLLGPTTTFAHVVQPMRAFFQSALCVLVSSRSHLPSSRPLSLSSSIPLFIDAFFISLLVVSSVSPSITVVRLHGLFLSLSALAFALSTFPVSFAALTISLKTCAFACLSLHHCLINALRHHLSTAFQLHLSPISTSSSLIFRLSTCTTFLLLLNNFPFARSLSRSLSFASFAISFISNSLRPMHLVRHSNAFGRIRL